MFEISEYHYGTFMNFQLLLAPIEGRSIYRREFLLLNDFRGNDFPISASQSPRPYVRPTKF